MVDGLSYPLMGRSAASGPKLVTADGDGARWFQISRGAGVAVAVAAILFALCRASLDALVASCKLRSYGECRAQSGTKQSTFRITGVRHVRTVSIAAVSGILSVRA